jgi:hypothetical protein
MPPRGSAKTSAGRRVNAAWLQPISTDPGLLVNREEELDRLVSSLEEQWETGLHEAHLLVSGARGVGKSIFTRTALVRFEHAHPDQAVCITVDCRGLKYRPFLSNLALALIGAVRPRVEAAKRTDLALWLDQLNLFATYADITRAQTETIGRKYGVDATVGAELFYKLQSRFAWEETRSLGTTTQTKVTVTDELLHDAIGETLKRLAAETNAPWFVVVFFDNMDQAVLTDSAEDVETLFRRVLSLRPCLSIVHFRTETMVENVKREATEVIDVPALSPDTLLEIVRRRLEASVHDVQAQFREADWTAIRALSSVTGNALVFLRWVYGLLRTQSWPPAADWTDVAALEHIVRTSEPLAGADSELIHRMVRIVDHCDGGAPEVVVLREHLVQGSTSATMGALPPNARGQPAASERLTDQEVDLLVKLSILLPKHRYEPALGYRIAPVLNILRPTVRRRLVEFLARAPGQV